MVTCLYAGLPFLQTCLPEATTTARYVWKWPAAQFGVQSFA